MPSPYLSKSDFKACFDCQTKLFYRKNSYPSNLEENEYLQFLADGGFMIEVVAKAKYPNGQDLAAERDHLKAFQRTQALINGSQDTVIFEAAAIVGKFLARIDILRREGNTLHLIEIKSSSLRGAEGEDTDDSTSPFLGKKGEHKDKPNAKWRPYLLDVAFQTLVLRQAFPEFTVKPWLCVVNKSTRAAAQETLINFSLKRDPLNPKARPTVRYARPIVELKGSKIVMERDVSTETDLLMEEVKARASELAALLGTQGQVVRKQEPIAVKYKDCRKCEYRFRAPATVAPHGFAECWGRMAAAPHHILDLHRVTQIGSGKVADPVPPLLAQSKASLLDLADYELGSEGSRRERRFMQWNHSQNGGSECLPPALQQVLLSHQKTPGWPLLFVDFEACNVALPHHPGLRPYERVAFQWSCHRLEKSGVLKHAEWLNTGSDFPNFAFARSLRQEIGDTGTVYVWSHYEQSTLSQILVQVGEWINRDPDEAVRVSGAKSLDELNSLANWIDDLLGPKDENGKHHNSPRIRDLHKLALEHYFHPEMLGRTSIKVVLPAIWRHNPTLRRDPWFADYAQTDSAGQVIDPYKTLPRLPLGDDDDDDEDDDDVIVDGTGAIRIYQDLIFQKETSLEYRGNMETLLKQYCKLDTLAMVIIWKHWITS
jgi:hypothetical protein